MSLPRWYRSVWNLIEQKVTTKPWKDWIVRKSGIRLGGAGELEEGEDIFILQQLPPGGAVGDMITKMPTPPGAVRDSIQDRKAIGWRGGAAPHESRAGASFTGGPPANCLANEWVKLRDSGLRSGVDNDDRHGFGIDPWTHEVFITGPTTVVVRAWWERQRASTIDPTISTPARFLFPLWEGLADNGGFGGVTPYWDTPMRYNFNGEIRFTAYVSHVEPGYQYRFRVAHVKNVSETNATKEKIFPWMTTTGRFISDWWNTKTQPVVPRDGERTNWPAPVSAASDIVSGQNSTPRAWVEVIVPAGRVQKDEAWLRDGRGVVCIPFAEIEQRAYHVATWDYLVQDEHTPSGWNETEIQRRIDNGTWPPL